MSINFKMDRRLEIQLPEKKNIDSINVDLYDKFTLENKRANLIEYDINNLLSVTEVFDSERQNNEIYRIYGNIEWLSILNGLRVDYVQLRDFFLSFTNVDDQQLTYKNLLNSFEVYLVKPSTGFTHVNNTDDYIRYFEVIATPNEIDIYNAGFSKNIFNEQEYSFNLTKDIDVSGQLDGVGFPLTELFLYFQYIPQSNGNNSPELMQHIAWSNLGSGIVESFDPVTLNIGDKIIGDKVRLSKLNYTQSRVSSQYYYIQTVYNNDGVSDSLFWRYNPFIPLRLRYFNNEVRRANTGNTSYEVANSIPYYAIDIGDGNYVWRDILPQGYVDPITGNGVDYPFVNGKRYLFSNVVLDTTPSFSDYHTAQVFSEINFNDPININSSPITDLDNIGKPCQ